MPFPVSNEEIRRTEEALSRVFPLSLRAKLMRDNGGELEIHGETWWLIPVRDSSSRKRIARTTNDVLSETREIQSSGVGFPKEGVAIAQNGSGDYLVLLPDETRSDRFSTNARIWRLDGAELSQHVELDELFDAANE